MASSSRGIKAIDRIMADGKWRSVGQILRALSGVDHKASLQDIQAWVDARHTALDRGLRLKHYTSGTKGKTYTYYRILPPGQRFHSSILQFTQEELTAQDLQRAERERAEQERKERERYGIPNEVDEERF